MLASLIKSVLDRHATQWGLETDEVRVESDGSIVLTNLHLDTDKLAEKVGGLVEISRLSVGKVTIQPFDSNAIVEDVSVVVAPSRACDAAEARARRLKHVAFVDGLVGTPREARVTDEEEASLLEQVAGYRFEGRRWSARVEYPTDDGHGSVGVAVGSVVLENAKEDAKRGACALRDVSATAHEADEPYGGDRSAVDARVECGLRDGARVALLRLRDASGPAFETGYLAAEKRVEVYVALDHEDAVEIRVVQDEVLGPRAVGAGELGAPAVSKCLDAFALFGDAAGAVHVDVGRGSFVSLDVRDAFPRSADGGPRVFHLAELDADLRKDRAESRCAVELKRPAATVQPRQPQRCAAGGEARSRAAAERTALALRREGAPSLRRLARLLRFEFEEVDASQPLEVAVYDDSYAKSIGPMLVGRATVACADGIREVTAASSSPLATPVPVRLAIAVRDHHDVGPGGPPSRRLAEAAGASFSTRDHRFHDERKRRDHVDRQLSVLQADAVAARSDRAFREVAVADAVVSLRGAALSCASATATFESRGDAWSSSDFHAPAAEVAAGRRSAALAGARLTLEREADADDDHFGLTLLSVEGDTKAVAEFQRAAAALAAELAPGLRDLPTLARLLAH
ncbi:hypothetical protein SO694_00029213 [Aureococcus anophagefferens]|uniref:Chorein N-terminal domain-containing protein n=1 Tax=Aureococcus anophagefferens TaxID=44056 RepID=A0ABR1FVV4_AURAN